MEHAKFDAKVANALLSAGREIVDARGGHTLPFAVSLTGARLNGLHAPYTLADPAPLADEQAEAAAKAGACVRSRPRGATGNVYRWTRRWERWQPDIGWMGNADMPPGSGGDRRWYIAPDPSRAAESMDAIECEEHAGVPAEEYRTDEDEPVTFGLKAAQAAWRAESHPGGTMRCRNGQGPWCGVTGWPERNELRYRFAPGYQPTAAQVAAVVKAEPERLCADDAGCYRAWDGVRWFFWSGHGWTGASVTPDNNSDPWKLAIRPDYKPAEDEDEPEAPQDTLTACMRWCDDRDQGAWVRRSGFPLRIGKIESDGQLYLERIPSLGAQDFARPMELSTDEGRTWFSPSKGPEVEPQDARADELTVTDSVSDIDLDKLEQRIDERMLLHDAIAEKRASDARRANELADAALDSMERERNEAIALLRRCREAMTAWASDEDGLHDAAGDVFDDISRTLGLPQSEASADDVRVPHELSALRARAERLEAALGRVRGAGRQLLDHYDRETCRHEETRRLGGIWTQCIECEWEWADDRGGFQPYVEPSWVTEARAALEDTDGR